MTELLIVSKPRGRIFKWIGGGIYKEYLNPIIGSDSLTNIIMRGSFSRIDAKYMAQQFYVKPTNCSSIKLRKVIIKLSRTSDADGTLYLELWSDNNGVPGSKIVDIGSMNVADITTDSAGADYEFTPQSPISLNPETHYWIVLHYPNYAGESINPKAVYSYKSDSDIYPDGKSATSSDGSSWTTDVKDLKVDVYFELEIQINFDFIYSGTGVRRLEATITCDTILKIYVNGQDVGASLTKDESIPDADNYTMKIRYYPDSNGISYSIQRYLYYSKTAITLEDLEISDAFLQEIEFGENGGVLRVDDSPDSDLVGGANETIQFTDILVPFRKLEWISGGGEVLILGVE